MNVTESDVIAFVRAVADKVVAMSGEPYAEASLSINPNTNEIRWRLYTAAGAQSASAPTLADALAKMERATDPERIAQLNHLKAQLAQLEK